MRAKRFISLALAMCMITGFGGISAFADSSAAQTIAEESADDDIDEEPADEEDVSGDTESDVTEPDVTEPDVKVTVDDDSAVAGGGEEERVVTNPARNIRLKMSQTNELVIGQTFQIKYGLTPLKSDDYVTYKNYGKGIVKVDENGLVTAVGYGKARVQMKTTSGIKKNVYFIVTDAEGNEDAELEEGKVTAVEFADEFVMLRAGRNYQAEPIFYPLGLTCELTYSSGDTSVATVSQSGKITGVSAGTAVITASNAELGVSAGIEVTVYDDVLRGIDVSKWQGSINWKKVSAAGVDFVMIRSSFGSEDVDSCLAANVKGCEKYGIPYGFYHYTYARTVSEAKKEARFFVQTIRKYNPSYPVVLDIEEDFYKSMEPDKVADIIDAFMSVVINAGYHGMVYSYVNFFKNCTDFSRLEKYDIWIACWGDEDKLNSLYNGKYGMWQYSSTGKVNGIKGDVDMDYSYVDYEELIGRRE